MRQVRRGIVCAAALLCGQAAAAEVVVLKSTDAPAWRPALEALRQGLPGWTVTEHALEGSEAAGQRILAGLGARPVVVVAMGPLAAHVARKNAPRLPVVFSMVLDPEGLGLSDLPNTAGVAFAVPLRTQFASFKSLYPTLKRLGVMYDPRQVGRLVQEAQRLGRELGFEIVDRPVGSERDIPSALRELLAGAEPADALWVPPDPTLLSEQARHYVLKEALLGRKPVFAYSVSLVSEGALASSGFDFRSIGSQAANHVKRLAAAGRERPRPVWTTPLVEQVVNQRIADHLRLTLAADVLTSARIIK